MDAVAVAQVFGGLMGVWALGFGVGKAVAYVRGMVGAV